VFIPLSAPSGEAVAAQIVGEPPRLPAPTPSPAT
jgi:hypothetical protein